MTRILVTGSHGFVGTYLTAAFAAGWPEAIVTGFDARASSSSARVLDLLNQEAVTRCVRETTPDIIVHLAAQSSVVHGEKENPAATWSVNLTGSLNLALAVATYAPNATLLFVSSAECYGESLRESPVTEASPLAPLNAYARSKALAERMFSDVLPASAKLIIARPFNHTGVGQREDFVLPSFAGQVARIEAGLQPPQMRVGDIDVQRDFLDVRDVVSAYLALLAAASTLPQRFICNIASGRPLPLRRLAEQLQAMARRPFEIVVDPARLRPTSLPLAYADPERLVEMTGWAPKIPLETTLAELLEAARRALQHETASAPI